MQPASRWVPHKPRAEGPGTRAKLTYECTDGGQELRLHGLLLSEPAPDEDRVVRDLVRDLVREARERRRRADQR